MHLTALLWMPVSLKWVVWGLLLSCCCVCVFTVSLLSCMRAHGARHISQLLYIHTHNALLFRTPFLHCFTRCTHPTPPSAPGEFIIREGYPTRYMYFIRSGFVDVHSSLLRDEDPPGGEGGPGSGERALELLDTLCEGECFGELTLLRVPTAGQLPVRTLRASGGQQASVNTSQYTCAAD